jgi:lanosterol synthase
MQNVDGGFASYETTRTTTLIELLNPAEIFDRIMVEYSYPECTTAVLTALSLFHRHFPTYRTAEIKRAMSRTKGFIISSQLPDGSWYGSWAICFTYATFFALESLAQNGETWQTSARSRKGCEFLLGKQMADGGWGEHYNSCVEKRYIEHPQSQVVNTAWAVLGLMHARYPDPKPIERGLELIKSRQLPNGEWKQEAIEGVFNRTCMIGYPNYRLYFTVWALGRYSNIYLPLLAELEKKKV